MAKTLNGACLCGEVTFTVKDNFSLFHLCHCIQCRKITGSAHASNLFTAIENFTWTAGESLIKQYKFPKRKFTKVFCTQCGSGLPFPSSDGITVIIPAGALDDEPSLPVKRNIFWTERPAWYEPGLTTPHLEGFPE